MPFAFAAAVSRRGHSIAARAASAAELVDMPIPTKAGPDPNITARRSLKSTLTKPVSSTISATAQMACLSTSSAAANAASTEVPPGSCDRRRSFEITTSASVSSASFKMAWFAFSRRRDPSKPNGRVTTPTVSAPRARARRATSGATPDPVPPPMPPVIKTMSAPSSAAPTSWACSSAAAAPTEGSPPAPWPTMRRLPPTSAGAAMRRVSCAREVSSTCRSVLIASVRIASWPYGATCAAKRSMVFPPEPPTPQMRTEMAGVPATRTEERTGADRSISLAAESGGLSTAPTSATGSGASVEWELELV
mmetsp:Transcript_22705/g.57647  ORF Transcript_22705/g.57647 Transcript_22705/m.57647 type:complete len:307 (-) Transcript_22705:343-1263(-)